MCNLRSDLSLKAERQTIKTEKEKTEIKNLAYYPELFDWTLNNLVQKVWLGGVFREKLAVGVPPASQKFLPWLSTKSVIFPSL